MLISIRKRREGLGGKGVKGKPGQTVEGLGGQGESQINNKKRRIIKIERGGHFSGDDRLRKVWKSLKNVNKRSPFGRILMAEKERAMGRTTFGGACRGGVLAIQIKEKALSTFHRRREGKGRLKNGKEQKKRFA